jgi:hypothetical protein
LDNGLSWIPKDVSSWPASIDLTPQVSGTYGYLFKIALRGKPGQTVVRSFRQTTWVQVAPASLPSLRQGANVMVYRTGDHYGLKTRVKEVRTNAGDPRDLAKHLAEPIEDYDPARKTHRIRGAAVLNVKSMPETKIAWFCAGASFRTHLHEAARNTQNTIEYAVDDAPDFHEIYRASVPTDTEHWHYNACREVRLAEPADQIYVRYVGDPAVNNFQIYAHCQDAGRPSCTPVTITHVWTENGVKKTKRVSPGNHGRYEIRVDAEPIDQMIEISVPSHQQSARSQ